GQPPSHGAFHRHHVFAAQRVGHFVSLRVRLRAEHNLHDAAAVPQVDENAAAVVPPPVHPAVQRHVPSSVLQPQVSAPMGPLPSARRRHRHFSPLFSCKTCTASSTPTVRSSPDSMSRSCTVPALASSSPMISTVLAPSRLACRICAFRLRPM